MVNAVIYDDKEKERQFLIKELRRQAAYKTEDVWHIEILKKLFEAEKFLTSEILVDMICMEIGSEKGIALLEGLRSNHREMLLMIITDEKISPMRYMRPSILPAALLLRPFSEEEAIRVVEEFVDAYISKAEMNHGNSLFVVESQEGKICIPYNQIYFFESKEKKVFVQTGSMEYCFYKTLEVLEGELPSYFVRCHRSFIVNTRKIYKIMLSQSVLLLQEGKDVPLSRSYKPILKKLGKSGD